MTSDRDTSIGGSVHHFPTTIWSDILSTRSDEVRKRELLRVLLERYWKPIYFCIRRVGNSNEDAKDLTQEFIIHLIEIEILNRIVPGQAKFRTYLKAALKNFLIDRARRRSSARRGGRVVRINLDINRLETRVPFSNSILTPDQVFDRVWAETIHQQCLERLKEHLLCNGKELYWKAFEAYDLRTVDDPRITYSALGLQLGVSESDVRNYLSHVRNLLHKLVKRAIADSLPEGEDLESELRELFGPFRPSG